jgi:cytochrome c
MRSIPVLVLFLAACGGSSPPANQPKTVEEHPAEPGPGEAPATFADQVALGGTLYGAHCASCHGDAGQGGKAPRLVGLADGALPLDPPAERKYRTGKFVTVADVATFVVANMPPKEAGSLTADQYWAILAFDLKANGIELKQKLDPALAATLTIPR